MNTIKYPIATESVVTRFGVQMVDWLLFTIAPSVRVVGSRHIEDGIELVVEGEAGQVSELIYVLGQGAK